MGGWGETPHRSGFSQLSGRNRQVLDSPEWPGPLYSLPGLIRVLPNRSVR